MESAAQTVTRLLLAVRDGERGAYDELLALVYGELKGMAAHAIKKLPAGQTLQPTALVNEAYLRLSTQRESQGDWENRRHFFYVAARSMRDILVEEARRKASAKRGGEWKRTEGLELSCATEAPPPQLLALEAVLEKLAQEDPEAARLVDLRFFAGLSQEETAKILGVSTRTVQREWRHLRARLYRELTNDE